MNSRHPMSHLQFVCLEGLVTSISDLYPSYFYTGHRRQVLLLAISLLCFLVGLFMVTEAGLYVFQLFDYYACSGIPLMLFAILETICIGWAYGADCYYNNITDMIGYRPAPYMKYCWKFFAPCITTGTLIFAVVKFSPLRYNNSYNYPVWANTLGLLLVLSSVLMLPVVMFYRLALTPGTLRKRIEIMRRPEDDIVRGPQRKTQECVTLKEYELCALST